MQTGGSQPKKRQPRLRLPFEDRHTDAGVWAYEHWRGLAVTVIAYLLIGIAFVGSRISLDGRASQGTILIDFQDIQKLDEERERLMREVEERQREQIDWQSIRNRTSNENALNENLKDDRGSNTAQLNERASEVENRMRANREAYEQGLAEARDLGTRTDSDDRREQQTSSSKAAGRVTVSYSFTNPVRHHRYLDKPAYRCEGGGEVVVTVAIDRNGEVLSAAASGGDACMQDAALRSARISRFDINASAPAKQNGTITYIFIPQ